MKKSLILFSAVIAASVVVGCSNNQSAQSNNTPPAAKQEPNPPAANSVAQNGASNPQQIQNPQNVQMPAGDEVIRGWRTPSGKSLAGYKNDAYLLMTISGLQNSNTIELSGKLRAFEGVGQLVLKGPDGKVIPQQQSANGEVMIKATAGAPEWGIFIADIQYPASLKGKEGTIELYTRSAKDGSQQNKLIVKIAFE